MKKKLIILFVSFVFVAICLVFLRIGEVWAPKYMATLAQGIPAKRIEHVDFGFFNDYIRVELMKDTINYYINEPWPAPTAEFVLAYIHGEATSISSWTQGNVTIRGHCPQGKFSMDHIFWSRRQNDWRKVIIRSIQIDTQNIINNKNSFKTD